MKTKNILFIILALIISVGCERTDFDEILRRQANHETEIDDAKQTLADHEARVKALETLVATANSEITTIKGLVAGLEEKVSINSYTELSDKSGYELLMSDGSKIVLKNGETPVVNVKQHSDGLLYWTLNGEFMLDGDGKMVLAQGVKGDKGETGDKGGDGADGQTPQTRVNSSNEWEVSLDSGTTWQTVKDSDGNAVKATGEKGEQGVQGPIGPEGVAGSDATVDLTITETESAVTIVYKGVTYTIPKGSGDDEIFVKFDNYDTFYASDGNNEIEIILPETLKETDYSSIMATVTNGSGISMDVQTRAARQNTWGVKVSKPIFSGGTLVEGSVKVTLTAPTNIKLSETAWLKVTIIDNQGREVSVSRPVKYFEGEIVESAAGGLSTAATDNSVTKIAVVGSVDVSDLTYIKTHLTNLEVLDLSMTDMTVMPDRGLMFPGGTPNYKLRSVILPSTVTVIEDVAFGNCRALEAVDIEHVQSIGKWAFENCYALREINLGDKLTVIDQSAFMNCKALSSINIPANVETLGRWLFEGCDNLETITLHEGLRTLSQSTFYGCGITSIRIPSTVTEIPNWAFQDCKNLESITLHNDITSIGEGAFNRCGMLKQFKIPTGVKILPNNMFDECINLQFVDFHDGITDIQERAFAYCRKLEGNIMSGSLRLPSGLQTLGNEAFIHCESIREVVISSVKTIDDNAFMGCTSLRDLYLPSNLETIGNFAFHACDKLIGVRCHAATAPTIGTYTFHPDTKDIRTLVIPSASDYSSWAGYFNEIEPLL